MTYLLGLGCVGMLLCAVVCCGSCSGAILNHVHASPNGNWVAYLSAWETYIPAGPEPIEMSEVVTLYWAPTDNVKARQSLRIGAHFGERARGSQLWSETHLTFSPQGEHLAVTWPGSLLFIELATGRKNACELKHERVTSFCWLDEETLGYVTYAVDLDGDGRLGRTVWRQRWNEPIGQRAPIHHDPDIRFSVPPMLYDEDGWWFVEFWSPDGRYVLLPGAGESGPPQLLATSGGPPQPCFAKQFDLARASWNHAGTQVLCQVSDRTNDASCVLLLDVPSGDVTDLSREFREMFSKPYLYPNLKWTPDDRFLVGSDLRLGGFLIQPTPWEVRLLGKKHAPQAQAPPWVHHQPAPGLLTVRHVMQETIIDYEGNVVKSLAGPTSTWTLLPDGKRAVGVFYPNKLVVEKFR